MQELIFSGDRQFGSEGTSFGARQLFGERVKDIQHVGSTSILTIKAKPIIDIAIAVDNFKDVLQFEKELEKW